jgi:drug/metabolite transporter (DMT)-like permease
MDIKVKDTYITKLFVMLAIVASSIEPIIVKIGYTASINTFELLSMKLILGGMFMSPLYFKLKKIKLIYFFKICLLSIIFTITYVFIYLALQTINASTFITIITTIPVFVAMINKINRKIILGINFWFGFLIILIGIVLSVRLYDTNYMNFSFIGFLFAFLSVLCSAIYRTKMDIITKKINPYLVSSYLFLINLCFGLIILLFLKNHKFYFCSWPIITWLGFSSAIANIAFIKAIHILGSTKTSILTLLQRPLVIFISAILLNESLSVLQITGIMLVILGVYIANKIKFIIH